MKKITLEKLMLFSLGDGQANKWIQFLYRTIAHRRRPEMRQFVYNIIY